MLILGELVYFFKGIFLLIMLKLCEYEVFMVVLVKEYFNGIKFVLVGLIEMFNFGGVIVSLRCDDDGINCVVKMKLRGSGLVGVYLFVGWLWNVKVDLEDVEYWCDGEFGMVIFILGVLEKELYFWDVVI